MALKVVTFNLRIPVKEDGANFFFYRAPAIVHKIKEALPDIIAFQEALPESYRFLQESLPAYTFVGVGRGADLADEACPIAFRRGAWDLAFFSQNWLSPRPHTPGSRYEEQSICPRIFCRALLKEHGGARMLWIYNTHLDHISEKARYLGMKQILHTMSADVSVWRYPVILLGDMNADPGERCLTLAAGSENPDLVEITGHVKRSFHDFHGGSWQEPGEKYDYIFTDLSADPDALSVWDEEKDGVFLSDHYPIEARLNW